MDKRKPVHTVPNAKGSGWVNKAGGHVVSRHRKKRTAVKQGRKVARQRETEHRVHNLDGRIGRCNSYGGDSFPPRDINR